MARAAVRRWLARDNEPRDQVEKSEVQYILPCPSFQTWEARTSVASIFMVSSLALTTPRLQVLSHYPMETAGLIMASRGFSSLVTTTLTGRLAARVDARLLVGIGLLLLSYAYWLMTRWTPDVSEREIVIAIVIQGAAIRAYLVRLSRGSQHWLGDY